MSHRPLSDHRWYSSPTLIRQIATFDPSVTDVQLRGQIAITSKLIDMITAQSFWPITEQVVVRGHGDNFIKHPSNLPVIHLSMVENAPNRNRDEIGPWYTTNFTLVGSDEWIQYETAFTEIDDRSVYIVSRYFPDGFVNFRMTGTFGWVENKRGLLEAETTLDLNPGGTIVTVDDASVFVKRDVIDVGDPEVATPLRAIVEGVDYTLNEILIDEMLDPVLVPAGSPVTSWGQVPNQIEFVIAMWIRRLLLSGSGAGSGSGPIIPPGRIKRERVDSYEYERYDAGDNEYTGEMTGDPLLDRILDSYSAPIHLGFV